MGTEDHFNDIIYLHTRWNRKSDGSFAYFLLYIYDKWKLRGFLVFLYFLILAFLSIGIEWISDLAHVYTYLDWSLLQSFSVYLITLGITIF